MKTRENSEEERKPTTKVNKKIIRERKNRIEKWIYLGLLHSNVL